MTPQRESRINSVLDQRQNDLTVVLENVFDPHNISAVLRSCDAVGIQEVYVLNTRIPPHRRWGPRSSSSAAAWMTVHQYTDTELCLEELRKKYDRILSTRLSEGSASLHDLDLTVSTALVFGNEHEGVSEAVDRLTDGRFMIPQVGMIRSLNISVACAVTLYEAYRQKELAGHYRYRKLDQVQYDSLMKEWSHDRLGADQDSDCSK